MILSSATDIKVLKNPADAQILFLLFTFWAERTFFYSGISSSVCLELSIRLSLEKD